MTRKVGNIKKLFGNYNLVPIIGDSRSEGKRGPGSPYFLKGRKKHRLHEEKYNTPIREPMFKLHSF